jgi:hypothetical protein
VRPIFLLYLHDATESHLAAHVQTPRVLGTPKLLHNLTKWLRSQLPDLDFKDLLPLSFEGLNGGIVLGNMATPNVLVGEFSRADGTFGIVPVCWFAPLLFFTHQIKRIIVPVKVTPRLVQATVKCQVPGRNHQPEGEWPVPSIHGQHWISPS